MKNRYQLIHADCFRHFNSIEDESVDLIFTDPPYTKTWEKWDDVISVKALWRQYNRIIKPNGAILIFGMEPFSSFLRIANIKNYRYDFIWDKLSTSNFANSKRMPLNNYELISVFYKKSPYYNPVFTKAEKHKVRPTGEPVFNNSRTNVLHSSFVKKYGDDYDNKLRYPTRIIRISSKEKECNSHFRLHPCQKPVSLCEYLIRMYSKKGDIVLDSFMGAGSIGEAAINLNRKYIGIEKSSKYYKIASKRIESIGKL